ncbi:MAG: MFS transporter [Candidatus Bipolaricaulis anaerobius]|mgnify:CR=1 FL=1|uniref:Major facilitator superfamily domain, general substrate transporter, permeases component n=1 Tax=Candidatus Bipolaricaulis anaerobius TaxID=2026885 RepID=A0A2X3KZV8_9BACT|nr:MFS transporter [Candidatus Bipolaricaulis anaerobius]MBP7726625.1 MFS transporter [Candidatus Bipolaricaulis sp.]MDD3747795.1 MFS transporter [Candidatus Bipolaricaulis anaerobius]MDD5764112.1 MFS transporter [Candidatus Bipolaricaulis anaerobius]SQD92449.1 Putative major facilitator superfamily domain, general substrate transporter, permeases component [Candidatus Bipolaricaulis anaerobius]HOD73252.1 MFS transporter [Candidatus Bipolaricaulis anaerobius]
MRAPRWYWAYVLSNAAMGAASPLLSLYAYYLGATAGTVGTLAAVGSLMNMVASLVWGRLLDRTRRRRVFVALSFFGVGIAYLLLPLITQLPQLLLVNGWVAFAWMAASSVSILLVLAGFPKEHWEGEIARFNVYCGVGWTLGLALGAGWIALVGRALGEGWSLKSLGIIVGALALGGLLVALREIREPRIQIEAPSFRDIAVAVGNFLYERFRYGPVQLYDILRPSQLVRFLQGRTAFGPDLVLCYYAAMLAFGGFSIVFAPFPVFVRQELGWPSELVFALNVVHHGVSVVAFGLARRAVARWGHRPAAALALLGRAGMFVGFALTTPHVARWLLPLLWGVAGATWALFQLSVTAIVSRLSPSGLQGQGLGIYNAVAGLGNVLGALAGGFVADFIGFPAAFLLGAMLMVVALPILLVEGRPVS